MYAQKCMYRTGPAVFWSVLQVSTVCRTCCLACFFAKLRTLPEKQSKFHFVPVKVFSFGCHCQPVIW